VPLEDEILTLAKGGRKGAIRIAGPAGSGKSTALRHLAAVLPPIHRLSFLDGADRQQLDFASARGVLVYAGEQSASSKHLATLNLALWGDDEWIEYLLPLGNAVCGSVMKRLRASTETHLLSGSPELWQVVLDRMAEDESLTSPRRALQLELNDRLPGGSPGECLRAGCLSVMLTRPPKSPLDLPDQPLRTDDLDLRLRRLLRHRLPQRILAAERILEVLRCDQGYRFLALRFPRDLVDETVLLLASRPEAVERLKSFEKEGPQIYQPTVVSLLLSLDKTWMPRNRLHAKLSGAYLDGAQWAGISLVSANLEGVDFSHADLTSAALEEANARNARLAGASLRFARFQHGHAEGAHLRRAGLGSINAGWAFFNSADLSGADLSDADLQHACLLNAKLVRASLVRANLSQADLQCADLRGADFSDANLERAILTRLKLSLADFSRARLSGAILRWCNLEGMELPGALFENAILESALLTGSRMVGANFRNASLRKAGLAEVNWENVDLRGADLRGATFHMGTSRSGLVHSPIACEGSRTGFYTDDFNEQDFKPPEEIRKANLRGADLRGAKLDNTDFYLVDLRDARYDADQAEHLRRCGAILDDRAQRQR
jgi:uncharacterized protein YjbI with pentapeptide repeats